MRPLPIAPSQQQQQPPSPPLSFPAKKSESDPPPSVPEDQEWVIQEGKFPVPIRGPGVLSVPPDDDNPHSVVKRCWEDWAQQARHRRKTTSPPTRMEDWEAWLKGRQLPTLAPTVLNHTKDDDDDDHHHQGEGEEGENAEEEEEEFWSTALIQAAVRFFIKAYELDGASAARAGPASASSSIITTTTSSPPECWLDHTFWSVRATRWWLAYAAWYPSSSPFHDEDHYPEANKNGVEEALDLNNQKKMKPTNIHLQDEEHDSKKEDPKWERQRGWTKTLFLYDDQYNGRRLLRALLHHHVQQLPFLQQQLYRFVQAQPLPERPRWSESLQAQWQQHVHRLQILLGEAYLHSSPALRALSRRYLGQVWQQYLLASSSPTAPAGWRQENTSAAAIDLTLRVLHRILRGRRPGTTTIDATTTTTPPPSSDDVYQRLLWDHLLPLHRPNGLVLWRDQMPILALYHEPLVQCVASIIQHDHQQQQQPPSGPSSSLIPQVVTTLLQPDIFPEQGHTPKQIFILHEIDTLLGLLPETVVTQFQPGEKGWWEQVLRALGRCMASEHSQVAERSLQFFRNVRFKQMVFLHWEISLSTLLPFLVRSEPSWNPTVRKMTYHVLKSLEERNPETFPHLVYQSLGRSKSGDQMACTSPPVSSRTSPSQVTLGKAPATRTTRPTRPGGLPPPSSFSSSLSSSSSLSMQPGSGSLNLSAALGPSLAGLPRKGDRLKNPPLTITGVAPWAVSSTPPRNAATMDRHQQGGHHVPPSTQATPSEKSSYERYKLYMAAIKPADDEQEGASSWSKTQMLEAPTLLPDLKFHDLVFGHDLGTGSFGSVKYARLIDRTKTRSNWTEFAVKVISTEKIREMGYELSIQREIAVLCVLSHPGIARLISSFRFREGAYLVLEYASRGDLHTLLRSKGSLDHDSTCFLIGEVVAALDSIHELGLVYADLKPENIVITESGHVKLTDFGGCRPVTAEAKALIDSIAKNLLRDLRDGDWTTNKEMPKRGSSDDDAAVDMEEDIRIEGTTAYLPPEVVAGEYPTAAADSWALGCVMYQCLSGRPPLLEMDDEATRKRIVTFDLHDDALKEEDRLFQNKHAAGISVAARSLIVGLLSRDPSNRPRMQQVAVSDFFVESGVDVFTLYHKEASPLDAGTVAPAPDARWARRQFSSIWAPQPPSYNLTGSTTSGGANEDQRSGQDSAIPEGDESDAPFSGSATAAKLPPSFLPKIQELPTTR